MEERLGTLILYSAGIGQVALDHVPGEPGAANSVFTHTLAPLLKTPGLDLLDVAKQTQRRVDTLARRESHTQTPAFYSQLLTDVHLAGRPPAPPTIDPEAARKAVEAEIAQRIEGERKRWEEERTRLEAERKKVASVAPPPAPATAVQSILDDR